MGDNIPYKSFERYIFRAAHSPIDEIRKLMSEDVVFRKDLRKLSTNPSIKEAPFHRFAFVLPRSAEMDRRQAAEH